MPPWACIFPGKYGSRQDPPSNQAHPVSVLLCSLFQQKAVRPKTTAGHFPENESELKALLINDIEEVIHAELTDHSETYVEDFAHGGMSSGYVSGQFWLKRGIPMLCERLKA